MRCLSIEELRTTALPASLPSETRMGVWKRSTGFEVVLPYRLDNSRWVLRWLGLLLLVGVAVAVGMLYPATAGSERLILFGVMAVLIAFYMAYLLMLWHEIRATRIRIDMTPMTLTFILVKPSGINRRLREIPVRQIDEVCIEVSKGLGITTRIDEFSQNYWFAKGLRAEELHYLSCVLGQIVNMSAQAPDVETSISRIDVDL